MRKPLADQLREHYDQVHLSADQLAGLKTLHQVESAPRRAHRWLLLAPTVSILVLASLWISKTMRRDMMLQQIVTESINSHIKNMTMDVRSESLVEIRDGLNELGFRIQPFEALRQPDLQLQGGRYCSLLGAPAALLRFHSPGAGYYTLYQVPLPGELANFEDPQQFEKDGINVTIWTEKGVMLVLAGDQPASF